MSDDYRNRRVLVVGLGRSGVAACALLRAHGAEIVANDRRTRDAIDASALSVEAELVLGSHPIGARERRVARRVEPGRAR